MGQNELNEAFAAHLRKPGDAPLNPTGKQQPPQARLRRLEIKQALHRELDEPCDVAGLEHLTWFRAGLLNLLRAYVAGAPWAVKEVHNRAFGRVPLNIAASLTMQEPTTDLSEMTLEQLAERAENVAKTIAAAMAPTTIAVVVDAVMVEEDAVMVDSPSGTDQKAPK